MSIISDWYPASTLPLAYRWSGDFIHALFPWKLDGVLNHFDSWLLGTAPARLLQGISAPWFTDLMQVSYCSFFVLIAASSLTLYLAGRKKEFSDLTLAIIISLYGTYVIFMLLPAHSPRFEYWYQFKMKGGWITSMISSWLKNAAYCGGAFPSGHAAVSLVICFFMWRYVRWWSLPFMAFTALLLLATLYGGYHYLADIMAGFLLGALASALAWNHDRIQSK